MTGSGFRPEGQRLRAGGPLDFGQHGAGLLAGAGVHEVVAEEDLRRSCARSTVFGHVVSTDVDGSGVRLLDHLDGNGLAVGTGHTIGLTLGGLDHEEDAAIVGKGLVQLEGEGLTLAHDGGAGRVLDAGQRRRSDGGGTATGYDPVVQAGEQVGSGDLGLGAKDRTALLRESELIPRENLLAREALPHSGELLEDTFDLGLVSGTDGAAISAVADVLTALHFCSGHALGAAAHLLEGDGRNVLHG